MFEEITLTQEDQKLCREIAEKRNNNKIATKIINAKRSTMSDLDINLLGFGGEVAYCRIFGLEPDGWIGNTSSINGTDDGDTNLEDGASVDVKTRKSILQIEVDPTKLKTKIVWFALMIGTFPTYKFYGMIHRNELFRSERLKENGFGKMMYIAKINELVDFPREKKLNEWM